jgi:hypothetical protein
MVWPNQWKSVLVITLFCLLLYPAIARADVPSSYITESVSAEYNRDGSLLGPVEMIGYVEVEVPNTQDVLQYLLFNLSTTQNTNLQSSWAYKGVAASPSSGDRTRLYLNTTSSMSNISYEVTNAGLMPIIYLQLDYSNDAGGQDIYSGGDNFFSFNLTINCTHDLSGVSLIYLRFARNTLNLNDSIHLYSVSATSGSAQVQDTDGDGFFDRVYWIGDLLAGVNVYVNFQGMLTPNVNFNENFMYVDFDQGTISQATFSDDKGTFTGMTILDRESRGPIREGIEMFTMTNWNVRGFIKNMASGLDYRIHGWDLYQIGQGSPLISSSTEIYPFGPGQTEYTDWYDTGVVGTLEKTGYYSSSWDWEVDWGTSTYSGASTATITLPVLYEIDAWVDKSVVIVENSQGRTSLSVQDLVRHIGYSGLSVNSLSINSVLPYQSSGGAINVWIPSGVRVLFINASGETDITSQVSIATQASTGSSDGFVNVNIPDIPAVIGRGLQQNEDIRLEYSVAGNPNVNTQTYQFCQSSTLTTLSGTPLTENVCQDVAIPGVGGVPAGPGGGPGAVPVAPTLYADIVREMGEGYFIADNLVRVQASYIIVDTGSRGVKDIRTLVYIPEFGNLDTSSLTFRIYDSSLGNWATWKQGTDYRLTDNGMTLVDGRPYREYLLTKIGIGGILEESLNLFNGDKFEIGYVTSVPVGTSFLITRAMGYNWYEDKYMFEDLYIPVRREGTLQDLEISEDEWMLEKVYVGNPVKWFKVIEVHNPNNVSVEHSIGFEVFPDTLSAHIISDGDGRESLVLKEGKNIYVDVIVRLQAGETKAYVLEAVTPPVLEIERFADVLESNEREIRFMINITVQNFALEDYPGVSLLFRAVASKIVSVMEGENLLNYSEYDDSTTDIFLGDVKSGHDRKLSIVYTEVPPILLAALGSVMYECNDYANMNVIVIPSERESGSYIEVEVVGPEPQLETLNAQLIELREVWPFEEVDVPVKFDIRNYPDGRYFVFTKFKENFQTILSDQSDFYVSCPERTIVSLSWMGFLGFALVAIGYLVFRFLRRKRRIENLEVLKKKLRKLK